MYVNGNQLTRHLPPQGRGIINLCPLSNRDTLKTWTLNYIPERNRTCRRNDTFTEDSARSLAFPALQLIELLRPVRCEG